jgi:hypothetical protein
MTCINQAGIFICDDLIDVWEFSVPQSSGDPVPYGTYMLDLPTREELLRIEPGDEIKISRGIDKIWTRVDEFDCCETIIATVIDSIDLDHPFGIGDKIQYQIRNVYEIKK